MATNEMKRPPKMELAFDLDDHHIKQIRECIEKGTLKIQVLDVEDIVSNRAPSAYIYD